MFNITNLSSNPLTLSDGKMIAAGDQRKLDALGDAEKKFEKRGWLSIYEEEKEQPKTEDKTGGARK